MVMPELSTSASILFGKSSGMHDNMSAPICPTEAPFKISGIVLEAWDNANAT